MFTGIVEEVGRVESIEEHGEGRTVVIRAERILSGLEPGDSVSLDGVCQTVVACDERTFRVQAIATTLSRTTVGDFQPGRQVNLERPIAAGERFGGHFVQGHVDAVAAVRHVERRDEMVLVTLELPEDLRAQTVLHGSIAVDGVSLTVNSLEDDGTAEVALIPYTYEHTNLSRLAPGSRVNVEADLIGKYVARVMDRYRGSAES